MIETTSIVPSSPVDSPFNLLLDSSNGLWKYALTNPDGSITRNGGLLEGRIDADVLALYALATALQTIPKGVTISIRATSHNLVQMGKRLTKPAAIPELPFLPFVPAHRTAWEFVLPILLNYSTTWQQTNGNVADLMALSAWAATAKS